MNKRFVICLNPFDSHFLPTISLAKQIQKNGDSVIYIGFAHMEGIVKNEGFNFVSLTSCTDKELSGLYQCKSYQKLAILYKSLHKEIIEKLNTYRADVFFIGISRYQIYLIPALSYHAKIFFYSLCAGPPWMTINAPPITSSCILRFKYGQHIINLSIWLRRFFRKGFHPRTIRARMFYPWTTMRRLCNQKNISWKFGIDGFFPSFPILTLGTKHFEFSEIRGVSFMGLCVSENRNYSHTNIIKKSNCPLIYCSLGTMSGRYRKTEALYSAIIELFKTTPQWNLIVGLGQYQSSFKENLPDNIITYDSAPQLSIIQKADLVITHGGYGTIKECIRYAVPMLVLPCSYDQRGNAARVHYHQIGLMDLLLQCSIIEKKFGVNTKNITPGKLKILIEELLYHLKYKENIYDLQQKIEIDNEINNFNQLFK